MFKRNRLFQLMALALVSSTSTVTFANPVFEENAIVIRGSSDSGWYQVQEATGDYENVCQFSWTANSGGEQRCPIENSGPYQVINHTTGERFPILDVTVTNEDPGNNGNAGTDCSTITPRVSGTSIILNSACSWTVQRDISIENSCDGNIASCDNLQPGNYTVWRWSGANNQFERQITETPGESATQVRGTFPVFYDVDGYTNLPPGQYDVSIDGSGNYFFDWAVISFNGCNWDGPIIADVAEPIGSNGGEYSLDLRNDNQFGVGHCETDIAVTKTGYRDGNNYPKVIRSIEQSANSDESNLKVTANGSWDSNSSGRGHVNMTVWLTNSASRDHSGRQECKQSGLTNAQLDAMGCGTVDIIIHGFDNSGDMAQNPGWDVLSQRVSMQDPENPNGSDINYHIIKRSGDFGERSSYNIQPVHRASAAYINNESFPTQDYNMEFDVMEVINAIIDSDDSAPFTKDRYVHDMQWTITGQSGNSVGGTRIEGIDGKFTFDRFTIPSFSDVAVPVTPRQAADFDFTGSGSATNGSWKVFNFDVEAGERVDASVIWDNPNADIRVYLRDETRTQVDRDVDGGSPGTLSAVATTSGRWSIGAKIKSGSANYSVMVDTTASAQPTASTPDFEFNASGSATSGSWKVFNFDVQAGDTVDASVMWDNPNADIRVYLRDETRTQVDRDVDGGSSGALSAVATASGRWSVGVKVKSGTANYDVLVNTD